MMQVKPILKKCWPYAKVLLSIALLAKAIGHVDWSVLTTTGKSIGYANLLLALIAQIAANVLAGLRWGWLMRKASFTAPLRDYVALYFSGGLINQGLPTIIGGDSYRSIAACRLPNGSASRGLRDGLFVVMLDRTLGLMGNNVLGAAGLIIGGATVAVWGVTLGYTLFAAMLGGAMVLALLLKFEASSTLISRVLARVGIRNMMTTFRSAWGMPYNIGQIVIAVVIHLLALGSMSLCLRAFGARPPIEALMVGMPALGLLLMLPISISGWGLRETTLSAVLAFWGVQTSLTVVASIFYGAIALLALLPGAYRLFLRHDAVTES